MQKGRCTVKKSRIIFTNILIMAAILAFVVFYNGKKRRELTASQIESFEDMTQVLGQVTANYLQGEQRICDVWAHYINATGLTMQEAADYIKVSHVRKDTSAHLLYTDDGSFTGLSTRPKAGTEDEYDVSYGKVDLWQDVDLSAQTGDGIHVTRAYTNPQSGEQSIAFYDSITLVDETDDRREDVLMADGAQEDVLMVDDTQRKPGQADEAQAEEAQADGTTTEDGTRRALLMRVIPLSKLEDGWAYPKEEYKSAELTMINAEGEYIIKGKSFKNSNFLEFYKSYTSADPAALENIREQLASGTGSFTMLNSHGDECLIGHASIRDTMGTDALDWRILSYVTLDDLEGSQVDWPLIALVSAGLVLLFVLDMAYMLKFNRRLAQVAKEAETASRAKTDFLSTMSHDIRTPMNAIIGLTTITEKNVQDPELVSENLRKIGLASNHLLTLINDILDISKVESGKLNLTPAAFSIVETAENLVNLSQPMVKEKNIDFRFHIRNMQTEYLYADQLRINQIFINILSNAIKYTQPGGSVTVSMEERTGGEMAGAHAAGKPGEMAGKPAAWKPGEVPGKPAAGKPGEIAAAPAEGKSGTGQEAYVTLVYRVADTGIGMSKEFMATMYQPFSRGTDSRVNTIQGTGLGLAITKQMVDLMGGRIDCESEEGKGTIFTVTLTLPVADQQTVQADLENVDVLLVDDDEILLETGLETLRSLKAIAETASSGEEAISLVTNRHAIGKDYDLVILDWKMPGMSGIEVVKTLRENKHIEVPILLISAYDWSDIEDAAKEAGANGFISKPLFRSRLYEKISEMLGRKSRQILPEDDMSDLSGMKVLVAEDNDINWEIIHALLEMYGIDSWRAENGQIAVDMLESAPENAYDLVFMDIQMPVMNGLEATRTIRAMTDSWAGRIPIIAMTADAFSENVSECMAAGMNGHIAKPIDTKLVLKELRTIQSNRGRFSV